MFLFFLKAIFEDTVAGSSSTAASPTTQQLRIWQAKHHDLGRHFDPWQCGERGSTDAQWQGALSVGECRKGGASLSLYIYTCILYTRIRICVNVYIYNIYLYIIYIYIHSHIVTQYTSSHLNSAGYHVFFLCKSDDILYCQAARSLWHWMLWAIWAPCLQWLWSDRWF